jgi:hypothetical protein
MLTILCILLCGCGPTNLKPEAQSTPDRGTAVISGVVENVEYYVCDNNTNNYTVVRFTDGKIKAFKGISHETFQRNRDNEIKYGAGNDVFSSNNLNQILSVKILPE